MTTEYCKARIIALALSIRVSTVQLFVLPFITREYYPKMLELFHLFQ